MPFMIENHKLTVIIAILGRENVHQQNIILYEALASHGYIVITMDQPHVAHFV
jgi:hypothetical protein